MSVEGTLWWKLPHQWNVPFGENLPCWGKARASRRHVSKEASPLMEGAFRWKPSLLGKGTRRWKAHFERSLPRRGKACIGGRRVSTEVVPTGGRRIPVEAFPAAGRHVLEEGLSWRKPFPSGEGTRWWKVLNTYDAMGVNLSKHEKDGVSSTMPRDREGTGRSVPLKNQTSKVGAWRE